MNLTHRTFVPAILFVSVLAVGGCKKKELPPTPPPPAAAPAPAPTAQLTATPSVVTAGDQVVLSWNTTNAATVSIEGIGDVPSSGVKSVKPTTSTTYRLTARGEGGLADASARVTVNEPPVITPPPAKTVDLESEFHANVRDIFFDYDAYDLSADAQAAIAQAVQYLTTHPTVSVVIGGYCDERGSNEYNLALGQKRADSAKSALVSAGISTSRLRVISYGKEKPFCTESTEACWQQNRRDGFTLDR